MLVHIARFSGPLASAITPKSDRTGIAIDGDQLATDDAPGRIASSHDRRNAILSSDNRAMCENAADVRGQPQSLRKQWRSGRSRIWADEDRILPHFLEVVWREDHACRTGNLAGADGETVQPVGIVRISLLSFEKGAVKWANLEPAVLRHHPWRM